MPKMNAEQTRTLAEFFLSRSHAADVHIWPDGTLHEDCRPGADIDFVLSRFTALRYSKAGDWKSEVNFLDKLDEEDFTWELARRGMPEEVLFPVVTDRL